MCRARLLVGTYGEFERLQSQNNEWARQRKRKPPAGRARRLLEKVDEFKQQTEFGHLKESVSGQHRLAPFERDEQPRHITQKVVCTESMSGKLIRAWRPLSAIRAKDAFYESRFTAMLYA